MALQKLIELQLRGLSGHGTARGLAGAAALLREVPTLNKLTELILI